MQVSAHAMSRPRVRLPQAFFLFYSEVEVSGIERGGGLNGLRDRDER